MVILATGDWQCTVANLDRCRKVLGQVLEIIRKEKVDYSGRHSRDRFIRKLGFSIFHFSYKEINQNVSGIIQKLLRRVQ